MSIDKFLKPSHRFEFSSPEKNVPKKCMSKDRWLSESRRDNSDPMLMYPSGIRPDSRCSGSSQCTMSCEEEAKDSYSSLSSSTMTLTNICFAVEDPNNTDISVPISHDDKEKMKDSPAVNQFPKTRNELDLPNFVFSQNSQALEQYEAPHVQIQPISSSETSSGTSIASSSAISSLSSFDSKLFCLDKNKSFLENSTYDSPISTGTTGVADFINATGHISSGLIRTAYSRLRDKDLLYKSRVIELENQVKKVPVLEMKLKALKDENVLLLQQLKYFSETARAHAFRESSALSNQARNSSDSKRMGSNIQKFGYCANGSGSENNVNRKDYSPSTKLTATAEVQTENSLVKDEIGQENPMQPAATVFDLPCQSNSAKWSQQNIFPIKCPKCCYPISKESLRKNIMKDQIIQTDPRVFSLERSTQTYAAAELRSKHFGSFVRNFDKVLSETELYGSDPTANDQILNAMKYIADFVSNDSKRGGNPSSVEPLIGRRSQKFHSKLEDFLISKSSNVEMAPEKCAAPSKVESAPIQPSNKTFRGVTKSVSSNAVVDSASHKIQKETDQLRRSLSRKLWFNIFSKNPVEHALPRPSLNSVSTNLVATPPDDYKSTAAMDRCQRPTCHSAQMPMTDDTSKNDRVAQQTLQKNGPKQIGDMSKAAHRHGAQRNLTLGVPVGSQDIKNTIPSAGGATESAVFSVPLDQERNDRCRPGADESERFTNTVHASQSTVRNKKDDSKGSLKEESNVFGVDASDELLFSEELIVRLHIVDKCLRNPDNAGKLSEKRIVRESCELIKRHLLETMFSANPTCVRKYLSTLAKYSSFLSRWIFSLQDVLGNTIVHLMVGKKNFAALNELMNSEFCNLNKFNKAGYTAAMKASVTKKLDDCDVQVIKRLFKMSDLSLTGGKNGETALILACSYGGEDMVKLLLESGADVNAQDNVGFTALMYAAEKNRISIVKQLINHPKCDLYIKDHVGRTAWTVASKAGNPEVYLQLIYHMFQKSVNPQRKRGAKCKLPPFKRTRKHISHGRM